MSHKIFRILTICLFAGLLSCQDKENRSNSEAEIFPPEEKQDELRDQDGPMERSRILAKMREDDELSAFNEHFEKAGLQEEFEGKEGLFTIFAPSNAAYDRIPAEEINTEGQTETVQKEGDDMRYYVVEGQMTVDNLLQKIRASEDGRYEFRTALGEKLWAIEEGDRIVLIDVLGNKARIVRSHMDEYKSTYHVIDNVLHHRGNTNGEEAN
jgi:uncharacterized surface protein with fasciclin (FAS1) repeats